MMLFGNTRTFVGDRHALVAPDGHVPSSYPELHLGQAFVLISPAMGAGLTQLLVRLQTGGQWNGVVSPEQTFLYVLDGAVHLRVNGDTRKLLAGGYALVPFHHAFSITAESDSAEILLFRKPYEMMPDILPPAIFSGHAPEIVPTPYLGDERARLQVLLPEQTVFDCAFNIFHYEPGAHLPFVETHVMEHGLYMLSGQGIYRLEDNWYPVQTGDAIWMAPYCRQWFVAMGTEPARYLYYKDVNRLPRTTPLTRLDCR